MFFLRRRLFSRVFAPAADRWLGFSFHGAVLLVLLLALWMELGNVEQYGRLWAVFLQHLQQAHLPWLIGAACLMPLNWLAETQKWHQVVRIYDPLPFHRALLAVWIGVGFSLFTPNRMGEYGGRILLVQPGNRWKATLATLVGNYSQLLVLLTAGLPAAIFFLEQHGGVEAASLGWGILAALALLYFLYFNMRRLLPLIRRDKRRATGHSAAATNTARYRVLGSNLATRFGHFLLKEAVVLQHFSPRQLSNLLGWSALRYGIYATQYFLLLQFFGISPGWVAAYAGIATIFLIQTSLPLPPLTGLVARGNLAVWIWQPYGADALDSLAATFVLWILNLVLPALIGTFSLFFVQTTKTSEHEIA